MPRGRQSVSKFLVLVCDRYANMYLFRRYTVHLEDLLHQFLCQKTGFVGMDVDTDDVAGVDVDHHVRIEVGALHRGRELGDVPRIHLPRCGRDQLRTHLGRVPRLKSPWKCWRLLTLETRMELCRKNSLLGSRRHVDTVPKRRPPRCGWCGRCAPNWVPSRERCNG